MRLLSEFLAITQDWRSVFPQQRTFQRAVRQALGSLVCLGRRCLTRIIWTNGGQNHSWSAEYFLYSRCQWEPQQLFRPILKRALNYCPQRLVGVAIDDTRIRKTGRCIPQAFYQRDPMSPPFHVNLVLGLRFLQASLLVPLHRTAAVGTRALPIRFQEVSRVKRPGKKASEETKQQYREACKKQNLSRGFVEMGKELRKELDRAGGKNQILVLARWQLLQSNLLCRHSGTIDSTGSSPQRFQAVLSRYGRLPAVLWNRKVYSRTGAQGRKPCLENHSHFLWWKAAQDPL
jgi:hypothetical protein